MPASVLGLPVRPSPPLPRSPHPARRRSPLRVVASALLATLAACGDDTPAPTTTVERPKPTSTPSIVMIDLSGLRHDLWTAHVLGRDARPVGARFTQALAPAGWSVPSLASIFTGWPPHEAGGVEVPYGSPAYLIPPPLTVAEMVRDEGYDTAAFVTSTVVTAASALDQGFEGAWREDPRPVAVADAAAAWLAARTTSTPFLLFVALDVGGFEAPAGGDPHATWIARSQAAEAQVTRLRAAAAKALGPTGLEIVFSDHGVGLGEDGHPAPARGGQTTDARLRARLEIRGPGFPPATVEGSCSLMDLLPTVRDVMGLPVDRSLAGRSLRPLAAHPQHPGLPVVAQEWRVDRDGKEAVERRLYVVRTATLKYVATFTPRPAGWTEEIFDLAKDPGETTPRPATDLTAYDAAFTRAITAVRDFLGGRRTHLNDEIVGGYLGR